MSRVTNVTGNSSWTLFTLRSFKGRCRVARGYSRCSGWTPTAWVGTRAKRRGAWVLRSTGRKAGNKSELGAMSGATDAMARASAVAFFATGSKVLARLLALISPSEMQQVLLPGPTCTTYCDCDPNDSKIWGLGR